MKTMSFEKRLNMRLSVNIGCMIVSAVLLALAFGIKNFEAIRPMYTGTFISLFVISLALYFKNKALKKDPEKMKRIELLETDERNVYILRVSYTIFTYVSIGILYVSMLIAGFFSTTVYYTLETLLCMDLILILLIRKLVEKKY
ncbi:hypothetical protein [Anaerotignum propionicum]|jgi:uncharacterized membrane protein|uniref:DUF2178 domain-containing protein n=1 Tax=Anaerotignum propionicum DSM 1682 TaxID=991789 RepID=A0A110A7Y8_ANAPI|nr:hypothetical protein [Anaerotignum propionicum]AMJ42098.1 hypothetical protein CPRO_25500 [Anaerotignum propionicum DSM 1682]SHE51374.1 hypothetical protein SAMN02745151_00917 [[Clostridium] propionicum DSM 1682] [Anaerotignum propionicum DSM 1682]HBF64645.1 hypothetical protein [Clostridium sp.]